jgi:hypothetical protein
MRIRFLRLLAAAVLLASANHAAHAAGARFWQVSTQADFLKGEVEGLSIDQHGRLVLGTSASPLGDSAAPFVWVLLHAPDGSVYAGTGNDGRVYRYAPDGTRTVFFDATELEVHALAAAPNGALYVGTSPDGKVYRVEASGSSSVYYDPEDKYIWALATDAAGVLYAATGEKGVIYRITAAGKGDIWYRTQATHATALVVDTAGEVLAGTESPGKVFRIRKDGSGFVLLDPGLQEISALRFDEAGMLYAAGFTGKGTMEDRGPAPQGPAPEPAPTAPVPVVSTEIMSMTVVDVSGAGGTSGPTSREDRRAVKGAVYRIAPDGLYDRIWESSDDAPYDVLPDADGSLLVATGNKGKIYRLAGDPARVTLVARADAKQVTALVREGRGTIAGATANPGKLLRLSGGTATRGVYTSEVRDAETVATWGTIGWRGATPAGASVTLFSRSGNTAVPDDTWSPWSSGYSKPEGEQILSPKARYLQWKIELTGTDAASPIVTSVTAAYLQRNLRPEVTTITLHPPGIIFQKPFSSGDTEIAGFEGITNDRRAAAATAPGLPTTASMAPPLGRRGYQKGLQTLIWKAEDDNDDELSYDVLYRREGETAWKPLKRGLTDAIYVWDTTSVPNGTYVVKIVASDAPANPPGAALAGERESRAFDIDNAPPAIEVTGVRRDGARTVVAFTVKDAFSAVQRVEYSLDSDRWRPIYPKDGISDSSSEAFEVELEADTAARAVVLRAVDAMNNVATARAEAPAERR